MFKSLEKKKEQEFKDASKARNERCIPIAEELIRMIGNYKAMVASDKAKEVAENYTGITEDILRYLLREEVIYDDVNYILRLVLEHFQTVQDFVVQSLNKSMERATEKIWGKESAKITMKDIDKVLQLD